MYITINQLKQMMRLSVLMMVLLLTACSGSKSLNNDYAITHENDFSNSTFDEQKDALQAYYSNKEQGQSTLVLYKGKQYLMDDFSKKFDLDDMLKGKFSIIKDAREIAKYSSKSAIRTLIKIDAEHPADGTGN